MTPEQAVALACDTFGATPAGAKVLRAADAITVQLDDARVVRVIPGSPSELVDAERVLAALPHLTGLVLAPLAPPLRRDDAVLVAYPRIHPGLAGRVDLAEVGRALAAFQRRGRTALAAGVELPAFDPLAIASRWLAHSSMGASEAEQLLAAITDAWPGVTGPTGIIHADAHPANWASAGANGWLLIDPEFLSIGPEVYDLAPLEVVERRLSADPSRFPSFLAGYEALAGTVDRAALAAACRVRELLSVAWLAAQPGNAANTARARGRLSDARAGRDGSWLA